MYSRNMEKRLRFLLEATKGGENRIKIIDKIRKRPCNMNQLSVDLELNYRTIRHHIDILLKEEIIFSENRGRYGTVFFPSADFEANIEMYKNVVGRTEMNGFIERNINGNDFFKSVLNNLELGILIVDPDGNPVYANGSASGLFGVNPMEILGRKRDVVTDTLLRNHKNIIRKKDRQGTYLLKEGKNKKRISYSVSEIKSQAGEMIGYSYALKQIPAGLKDECFDIVVSNAGPTAMAPS